MMKVLERLYIEKEELDYRIGKLINFLSSDRNPLGKNQEALLSMQLNYMKHYASCLNLRIDDLESQEVFEDEVCCDEGCCPTEEPVEDEEIRSILEHLGMSGNKNIQFHIIRVGAEN